MESQQVPAKDLPSEAAKETRKLFGVEGWTKNCSHYGPKKYYIRNIKAASEIISEMKLQSDHIWIGGFPRSGTHWLAEMTWLINNNLDFDTARKVNHQKRVGFIPLLPEYKTVYTENRMQPLNMEMYDKILSSRFFKTHMPLSVLPPKLLETSKMVYVARDPRDVLMSFYHISCDFEKFQGTLEDFFELFILDNVLYCPYFENVLEFWNARHNKNILFLFYEEMVTDLPSVVRRISKFFDKEFTESQYEQLCEYLQFTNMKNSETFDIDKFLSKDIRVQLLRKGKIGGWQEAFTEDMKKRFGIWMSDKLKDTDLSFSSVQLPNFS